MKSEKFEITFRPIGTEDVPNLVRWQRDAEVARWYWDVADLPDGELKRKWTEIAKKTESKTDRFIIVVNGHDIGEIQVANLRDYPETAAEVGIPNAASVDLFIGEPEWRDRGIGSRALRQFVDKIVFSGPGIETCTIDPEPENTRAIRSYEKAGFTYVRTYHVRKGNVDAYLMRRERGQD